MSIISNYKGRMMVIDEDEKVLGTKCKQCGRELDALAYSLEGKLCFRCWKENKQRR